MADGSRQAGWKQASSNPTSCLASQSSTLTAVSYFCGCGGLDLGMTGGFRFLGKRFNRLGVEVLAAYDHDHQAVEAYNTNIGPVAQVADVNTLDPRTVPAADLLLGGFPCQEFSHCGPRNGINSLRGSLYQAMVRYAINHRPQVVLGENVAGLAELNSGSALERIKSDFAAAGYSSKVWNVKAQDHGVPQARHRLIIAFIRNDLDDGTFEWPKPQNITIPARSALQDLLRPGRSSIPNQSQYFKAAKAKRGRGQGDERTPADGPAYTIRANSKSRVQFHYSRPRRLTVRECARLQTFPDEYIFPFSATTNMRLIGNAVPPVLAYAAGKTVTTYLRKLAGGV